MRQTQKQYALKMKKMSDYYFYLSVIFLAATALLFGMYKVIFQEPEPHSDTGPNTAPALERPAEQPPAAAPADLEHAETAHEQEQAAAEPDETADHLILVNNDIPAPPGAPPYLAPVSSLTRTLDTSLLLNEDALVMLKALFDAAAAEGFDEFRVTEAYRTIERQQELYDNAADKSLVALPGHSEHHTGLAVDISYEGVNIGNSAQGEWLRDNAHLYGYILRYPEDKEEQTGIPYEPWHYRYVGQPHAAVIFENGLVLEEYLEMRADE